jgi:tetratricopeptide (TPR) repeat protein
MVFGRFRYIVLGTMNLLCVVVLSLSTAIAAAQEGTSTLVAKQKAIDLALNRMYNCDFAAAKDLITEQIRQHPEDPLLYSIQASAQLFFELYRMKILELEFFADDEKVTDRKRLRPDSAIRDEIFRLTGKARKLSEACLAGNPGDADAMFAIFLASGIETDYASLVEKKYFRSYRLMQESQKYAQKLIEMNPPIYDAYLSPAVLEYVVGNLNFFFKLFIRFDKIKGNKHTAIDHLKRVVENGKYYAPYAKMLLSVIYLREKQPQSALVLLQELGRDFPENPLIRKEIIRISESINQSSKGHPIR